MPLPVDTTEFRLRIGEMLLEQLRHEVALRHSDFQRRFVYGLSIAGALLLYLLRAEVPGWTTIVTVPVLAWAGLELRRINRLAREEASIARGIIHALRSPQPEAKGSPSQEATRP